MNNIIELKSIDTSSANNAMTQAVLYEKNCNILLIKPIETQIGYENAITIVKEIETYASKLEDERLKITRPLDAAKNAVMDLFRPAKDKLQLISDTLRKRINNYAYEQEQKRQAEQRKAQQLADREAEKERQRLLARAEKAKESGKEAKAEALQEQAEAVVPIAPIVMPKIEQPKGVAMKTLWKYKVVDIKSVPREYLMINDELLSKLAVGTKGAIKVEGIEFYSEQIASIRK